MREGQLKRTHSHTLHQPHDLTPCLLLTTSRSQDHDSVHSRPPLLGMIGGKRVMFIDHRELELGEEESGGRFWAASAHQSKVSPLPGFNACPPDLSMLSTAMNACRRVSVCLHDPIMSSLLTRCLHGCLASLPLGWHAD